VAGRLGDWTNARCVVGTPGNFEALHFQPMETSPPAPGQIQIRAKAVSINFRDLMIAMGIYPPTPAVPTVMGSDYAGEVTACGAGVSQFHPGDRVMALSAGHFDAENRVVEGSHFCAVTNLCAFQAVKLPDGLGFAEAAGVPTVYMTAYYALHHVARVQRQERVLIHSATGGVGMAGLQVARWLGAEVFATAGSSAKRERLVQMGIAGPLDSRTTDFADRIEGGVDVILNTLSGEAARRGIGMLRPFGRFLQIDKKDVASDASLALGPFAKGLTYTAIDLSLFLLQPDRLQSLFGEVADHLAAGHFSPVPVTRFPAERIGEALRLMSHYKHIGKLVLDYEMAP
jgi:polyketide synthase 2/polyketide synthase 5